MTDKEEILDAIRRCAEENGGVAAGKGRFERLTGSRADPGPRPLPSFTLADTACHFLEATPAEALQRAADGRDVRLGGGAATIREFLEADLVDTVHVAVAPIELGDGARLWTSPDEMLDRFHLESVPSPSGVTHLLFWRR